MGLDNVEFLIQIKSYSHNLVSSWFPGSGVENYIASADIEATKPIMIK